MQTILYATGWYAGMITNPVKAKGKLLCIGYNPNGLQSLIFQC